MVVMVMVILWRDDVDDLGLPRATHTRLIFLPKANIFLKRKYKACRFEEDEEEDNLRIAHQGGNPDIHHDYVNNDDIDDNYVDNMLQQ